MGAVSKVDDFQRRHSVVGFPLAVVYKYFDDQGPYLAAGLTYYAFVAIFPLMLLGTSILGFVLQDNPELQEQILNSALGQFPIIGDELGRPQGIQGSLTGAVLGALTALYGCQGLGQALQNLQHTAWSVPRNSRPNPIYARVKTLLLLVTAGMSLMTVSVLTTVASTTDLLSGALEGWFRTLLLPAIGVLVVGAFLSLLFRFAATGQHSFWRAAPGGFALALMWQGLQFLGASYVEHVLVDTSSMAKTFGLVLGLIGFLWIGATMAVFATEINVVLGRRLWPRALLTPFTDRVHLTQADRRAYASYVRMQRLKGYEQVEVVWKDGPDWEADLSGTVLSEVGDPGTGAVDGDLPGQDALPADDRPSQDPAHLGLAARATSEGGSQPSHDR
ncbi:YihY/virulence factor BrkB family protein [Nocardioides campestrisoli]|uniref:YihY/virulence factor BrkB family protein n=1 Tax=Nocardioides campestrisoli TaxID=2736757 RepID=UPI0015E7DE92|nr:YihY/virulence factor BrkB family protein [Nocardioides campestrisoli]